MQTTSVEIPRIRLPTKPITPTDLGIRIVAIVPTARAERFFSRA